MTNAIIYLTFIPWILYYSSISKNAIKDLKNKKLGFYWFKKNFFNIFHFENLILYGIFIFFATYYQSSNQIWLVDILLFSAINLYLFINCYYDKNRSTNKLVVNDLSIILIALIISLIPFVYYMSTKNYLATYYILFCFSFFNYIIVLISSLINKFIIKLIIRKK